LEQLRDCGDVQWFEDKNPGTREQGGVDFERGVFGGRADEDDVAFFQCREKGVLL